MKRRSWKRPPTPPPPADGSRGKPGPAAASRAARHARLARWADEYVEYVEALGRSRAHVTELRLHLRRLLAWCEFELNESTVVRALGRLRTSGRGGSVRTRNKHLRNLKSFTAWLARLRYTREDPLSALRLEPPESDRRHIRAAFTDAQVATLLATLEAMAETADPAARDYGTPGPRDRAEYYHAAMATGLRAGTLRAVTVGQFDLDGPVPRVSVRADQEKSKKARVVPIHPSSAERLRRYFAGRPPTEPAFRMPAKEHLVRWLRRDLAAARIPYATEVRDERGAVVRLLDVLDFHSFRHGFGTRLALAGVSPRVAMALLGHSSMELTMRVYSHVDLEAAAAAVASMPGLSCVTPPPPPPLASPTPATPAPAAEQAKKRAA